MDQRPSRHPSSNPLGRAFGSQRRQKRQPETMTQALAEEKSSARVRAKRVRAQAAAAAARAGEALAEAASGLPVAPGACVSAYWPMGDEMDTRPLLAALHGRGHPLALPVVVAADTPLIFRQWRPGARLESAHFGTSVPEESAAELEPDVLFVPLLAFDHAGYRLGYGGGFYDRSLQALRARKPVLAVGVAFAGQRVASVPRDSYDQPLDWVVTESGLHAFG